jgi:hypothetical protein
VILNEALHHMEDPFQAMREVARVLTPRREGFLYEPYALNPYRMLSEIRDRLKGSIELSFSVRKLKKILENAGLRPISIQRHTAPPSDWKMEVFSAFHRLARKVYFSASRAIPKIFGNVIVVAQRPRELKIAFQTASFESIVRCPATGSRVLRLA